MVLIRIGAPKDEYSSEVGDIVAALTQLGGKPNRDEVGTIRRSVFDKWFGGVSRDEGAIDQMAEMICIRWDDV